MVRPRVESKALPCKRSVALAFRGRRDWFSCRVVALLGEVDDGGGVECGPRSRSPAWLGIGSSWWWTRRPGRSRVAKSRASGATSSISARPMSRRRRADRNCPPCVRLTLPDGTVVTSEQPDVTRVMSRALGREVAFAEARCKKRGMMSGDSCTQREGGIIGQDQRHDQLQPLRPADR
jgi:hypothetical protein